MEERLTQRQRVRDLADRMVLEYSGALPPGQVLAIVFRAHHVTTGIRGLTVAEKLVAAENLARRLLTERISHTAHGLPALVS